MLKSFYYKITAYLPRHLPTSESEYNRLKKILTTYYGVKNDPKCWMTIAGQLTGTPPTKLRRSYGELANCAKRLFMNELAQKHKIKAVDDLNQKLKDAFEAETQRVQKEIDDEEQDKQGEELVQKNNDSPVEGNEKEGHQNREGVTFKAPEEIGIGYQPEDHNRYG